MSGKYTPTTDEVETAFHEFASWLESTSPGEYAEAPEFADWQEAMRGFRRWRDKDRAEAQVEVLNAEADYLSTVHFAWKELYVGILRDRADRIAREAGIDSKGESNER